MIWARIDSTSSASDISSSSGNVAAELSAGGGATCRGSNRLWRWSDKIACLASCNIECNNATCAHELSSPALRNATLAPSLPGELGCSRAALAVSGRNIPAWLCSRSDRMVCFACNCTAFSTDTCMPEASRKLCAVSRGWIGKFNGETTDRTTLASSSSSLPPVPAQLCQQLVVPAPESALVRSTCADKCCTSARLGAPSSPSALPS
mmetsp:Transcript_100065/g.229706  ORF Transcript_100065/g.229706 Transcript_100065/m.229706 type:complete len:207 (-) Transcript_100065:1402-2022(-)